MQEVSAAFATAVAERSRRVAHRLLVEWTRNATEPAVVSTAASSHHSTAYLPVADVANGLGESFPYAVLDCGCKADGTWFPFPESEEAEYERGWWSANISGTDRKFTSNPYVEVVFASAAPWRRANVIKVISTTYYNRIAKFKLWYKRSTDTVWQGGTEYAMTGHTAEVELGGVLNLKAVRVEVTETAAANDHARLIEVDAMWREDISGMVRAMRVRKVREHLIAATVPYGRMAACELDVDLLEETGKFKPGGVYAAYMGPGVRLLPYFGVWTGSDYEYVPQGVFYTEDDWRYSEGMGVAVSARDAMRHHQEVDCDKHLTGAIDSRTAFRHLFHRGHERLGNMAVEAFGAAHKYLYFDQETVFDAATALAQAELATFYYDEAGTLRVDNKDHFSGLVPIATITDAELFSADIEEPERVNYVAYEYWQSGLAPRQEVYRSREELVLAPSEERELIGEFDKFPAPTVSSPYFIADPEIELLWWWSNGVIWRLVAKNNAASPKTISEIVFLGQPLAIIDNKQAVAKDTDLMRRHGKRVLEIEPPILSLSASAAQTRANDLLMRLKGGSRRIALSMRSQPHWQLGDLVRVESTRAGVVGNYAVQAIDIDKSNMSLELTRV